MANPDLGKQITAAVELLRSGIKRNSPDRPTLNDRMSISDVGELHEIHAEWGPPSAGVDVSWAIKPDSKTKERYHVRSTGRRPGQEEGLLVVHTLLNTEVKDGLEHEDVVRVEAFAINRRLPEGRLMQLPPAVDHKRAAPVDADAEQENKVITSLRRIAARAYFSN